ncbi:MAG: tyrosine-type recombinase/integrase [Gammaproteobacteria bacterium]|nr:tyrosine-type recombinase/integrase [Gammaproteobacteria bacterium]
MPVIYSEEINAALKEARGVQPHNGSLRVQFKTPDKGFVRKSIGLSINVENIKVAKRILEDINKDIQNRLYQNDPEYFWSKHFPTNSESQTKNISVRACFSEYIEENSGGLSDSILDKLKSSLSWLNHYRVADKPIKSIDKPTLEKIRKSTVSGNKEAHFNGCAVSTVKEYTNSFKKILDHAVEKEYIKTNPVPTLKKLPKDNYDLECEDDDIRPFSQTELDSLLNVVHVPRIKLMIKLLAWTGMRHGEIKALSWEDVNFGENYIHVRYNLTRKGNLKLPKTKAGIRKIELLPAAKEVLIEMKEFTFGVAPQIDVIHYKNQKTKELMRRRVFLSRDNKPYRRPELSTVPKQWANWLLEANLNYRPAYQLRHTYASQMLMAGAQPTWLATQMGHSDTSMISKIYGKWIPGQDPDYIHKLAEKLGQK